MSSPLKALQAKTFEMTSARIGFQPRPLNSYVQPLVLSNQTLHPCKKINKKIPSLMTKAVGDNRETKKRKIKNKNKNKRNKKYRV